MSDWDNVTLTRVWFLPRHSQQGPGATEQTGAAEGSGEEEEGAGPQGPEGGARGTQEEERPGDRADEETTEARTGTRTHTHTHTQAAITFL